MSDFSTAILTFPRIRGKGLRIASVKVIGKSTSASKSIASQHRDHIVVVEVR